jgi:hypothetical protein
VDRRARPGEGGRWKRRDEGVGVQLGLIDAVGRAVDVKQPQAIAQPRRQRPEDAEALPQLEAEIEVTLRVFLDDERVEVVLADAGLLRRREAMDGG